MKHYNETIAISNCKGGNGKTTLATTLASFLGYSGYTTLLLDLSGNSMQHNISNSTKVFEAIEGKCSIEKAVIHNEYFDMISSDFSVKHYSSILGLTLECYIIDRAISDLSSGYDFCLIDTPSTGEILTKSLIKCNSVLIPTKAEIYSIYGIRGIFDRVNEIEKRLNMKKNIEIVVNQVPKRHLIAQEVLEIIKEKSDVYSYDTVIGRSCSVPESQYLKKLLIEYDMDSLVAKDYLNFTREFLRKRHLERRKGLTIINDCPRFE